MADEQPTTSGHVNQPPSMQTSTTSSGNFFSDFQTVTQYQIMQLQRMVADLRGTAGREKEKIEKLSREFAEATDGIKRLEGKLVNHQKVVAKQTDGNKKLQKESTDKNNDNKSQITAVKPEIDALKQTAQSSSRQIEEIRRSGVGGVSAAVPIPGVKRKWKWSRRDEDENIPTKIRKVEEEVSSFDLLHSPEAPTTSSGILQKVVGKQQKESTDKDNGTKSQITAIKLDALKQTVQSLLRQIEEIRRSCVGGAVFTI